MATRKTVSSNTEVKVEEVKVEEVKAEVKAEEVKVEEVKTEEVKVEKKVGIGSTIVEMILKHPEMTNTEILKKVLEKFENAKTSYACIAWYKSDLRKKGLIGARVFAKKTKAEKVKSAE